MGQYGQRRNFFLLLKGVSLLFFIFSLNGCLFTYYVKSGVEQFKILSARKNIQSLIKDPKTPEDLKRKLQLSIEAQDFAESELGFKKTENYKSYVELDRPYVSWIVSVAHKDKLEYKMFDYAIVGELPYKGFFKKEEAIEEAESFKKKNYDTTVRGVTAYSTLGWFRDPILSSMTNRPDTDFVEVVLHESAHATLFIENSADFNEQLASFLGAQAARAFYLKKEGPDSKSIETMDKQLIDDKIFAQFLKKEIADLKAWYKEKSGQFTEEERQKRLDEIQSRFKKEIQPKFKLDSYKYFADTKLNNAFLLSLGTYMEDLELFEGLYKLKGHDLKKTLEYLMTLKSQKDPAQVLRNYLASSGKLD